MEVRKSYKKIKKPKLYLNGVIKFIKLSIPAFLVPDFFSVIWVICVASCHSFSRFFFPE